MTTNQATAVCQSGYQPVITLPYVAGTLSTRVSHERSRRADSRDHEIASIKTFPGRPTWRGSFHFAMRICQYGHKLGRLDEARGAAQAGLALNPAFRIARTYANPASDNPTFLARERIFDGSARPGCQSDERAQVASSSSSDFALF